MKERPILFNGEMVRAILDGRKTQTRRVIKPQPKLVDDTGGKQIGGIYWDFGWCYYWPDSKQVHTWDDDGLGGPNWTGSDYPHEDVLAEALRASPSSKKCPIGMPGDRLWVRETFWELGSQHEYGESGDSFYFASHRRAHYAVDGPPPVEGENAWGITSNVKSNGIPRDFIPCRGHSFWHKRPSIHMPRWASRLTLEITNVRVERIRDISSGDILAEGVGQPVGTPLVYGSVTEKWNRDRFLSLWESTGGDWESNPWVWVIEFKKLAGA